MSEGIRIILLFPFLGFLINGLLGKKFGERFVSVIGPSSVFLSFLAGIFFFSKLSSSTFPFFRDEIYRWISSGDFSVSFSLIFDRLSALMTLVVTGVGFLIHIYSIGYMKGDKGYYRYFAFLNLFVFMMLVLVLGSNLLLLFLGWEGVGLCSYLLIGFWFHEEYRARAGFKAFIVNRIGDFGFILGISLILYLSTLHSVPSLEYSHLEGIIHEFPSKYLTLAGLLLFVGATGKSAQVPLYVWLPDAMAGPTPVSALIHAATMVTAGVYMIARLHFLYSLIPHVGLLIAGIGAFTAFFSALMGLASTGIKKVLAYSTISQLGYMFVGVGVGAYADGMFHLTTHAFFKALLFLSAGSVIHALSGEEDIMKMGGLREKLPITYLTFLAGALALAGIPPFAGFFSKDEILLKVFLKGHYGIYFLCLLTALLTSFYTFRLFFLVFYNSPRYGDHIHPHESPAVMYIPLIILALLSLGGGIILGFPHHSLIENYFSAFFPHHIHPGSTGGIEFILMFFSFILAVFGWAFAYRMYVVDTTLPQKLAKKFGGLYNLLYNKFYIDEIYDLFIVKPFVGISDGFMRFFVDDTIIEGFLKNLRNFFLRSGRFLRRVQSGEVQTYGFGMLAGILLIAVFLAWRFLR